MSTEREIALMEAHQAAACDEYFSARAWHLDTQMNRRIYQSAYKHAWQAATEAAKRVPMTREQRKELFAAHLLHTTADGGELYDVELIADAIEAHHGIPATPTGDKQ